MFLSNFSIKRPVATVVLILVLMLMGLVALSKLRVNQFPDVEPPVLVVTVPYPGASPETVEREVLNRLEKSMQSIPGIDRTQADAREGSASIVLIFEFSKNMIEAADEVRNAIAAVRFKLPTEIREPIISRADPGARPIMQLALSSTKQTHARISRLAEDKLADRFRALPGVAVVTVNGALKRELSILLRAEKLREFGVSVTEVTQAVRLQNTTAPVGKVRGQLEDQSIRLLGRLESPSEFEQMIVKRRGTDIVRLGQVAEVKDGFAEMTGYSLRNGRPTVGISVTRSREGSTVSVADEVRKLVQEVQKELPEGTTLEITEDGGKNAYDSLYNVIHALVFGAGLTVFVVYVFLNSWRSTLITALSLPTSVLAAFIAVWVMGFSLNFMSLLGLSLAIGVLIDDAIVVRENIVRQMEMGKDRVTAAREGTAEIGLAVAATTFAIVAVFVPVAFMGSGPGQWFKPFALTVVASVLVSLLISFTLDPMLSAYWGDPPGYHHAPKKGISLHLQRFNDWFDHQADRYGNVIAWALKHRLLMALIAVATLQVSCGAQFKWGGTSFLPQSDSGTLVIDVRSPASSSLEYSKLKLDAAAALAATLPETKATTAYPNASGGRIYIDIGKSTERKRSAAEVAKALRERVGRLVGAEFVVLDDLSNNIQKPVQIRFYGTDSRRLQEITQQFLVQMRGIKGAVEVGYSEQDPQNELQIELDRGLANQMGISVNDAAQALRVAFAGVEAGDWVDPTGESRDVAVRLHPADRVDASNIEHLPIAVSNSNRMVPLDQIATITMGKGPGQIQHANGKRTITVSANVQGRSPGEVTAEAQKLAQSIDFPQGFGIELAGSARDQQVVFSAMGLALLSGIALMYVVLVIQFNSFTTPLGVMFSLPLSLIGVVLALLAAKATLNLMSLIGVIMLMGLVAKNAILLLDATKQEEASGIDREEALMHAGRKRFRPILMTTFALIAGMLPVAIGVGEGGEFYRPMAVAIIGGTITSTLLTLLMVPSFYDGIEIYKGELKARFLARRAARGVSMAVAFCVGDVLLRTVLGLLAIVLALPILLVWGVWAGVQRLRRRAPVDLTAPAQG